MQSQGSLHVEGEAGEVVPCESLQPSLALKMEEGTVSPEMPVTPGSWKRPGNGFCLEPPGKEQGLLTPGFQPREPTLIL